jgi:hypothetical protein
MIGGDVLKREKLRLLTARCDVGASREIIPGLYEVLPEEAARMLATGAAEESEFAFFAAVCQWSPQQIAMELERAIWLPAATSATPLLESIGLAPGEMRAEMQPPPEVQPRPEKQPHQPHALYFALIAGIGGEYARQARHGA